jgi:hypothetical protein
MTVQEFQAGAIEHAGEQLAHFLATTAPEKQDWVPEVEGAAGVRSVLGQIAECITVNRFLAGVLRGDAPPAGPTPAPASLMDMPRPFATAEEAGRLIVESAKELGDAVRGLTDADLTREFPTRRGPMPGYLLIQMPYRNMHYHGGQINLLQLLYGDTEFRPVPPRPKAP